MFSFLLFVSSLLCVLQLKVRISAVVLRKDGTAAPFLAGA